MRLSRVRFAILSQKCLPFRVTPAATILNVDGGWWTDGAISLAQHADNREIWKNLSDNLPHPYTVEDARRWIK
jgi:[ribosomal protein S5]-alanine N-acetyltransferase